MKTIITSTAFVTLFSSVALANPMSPQMPAQMQPNMAQQMMKIPSIQAPAQRPNMPNMNGGGRELGSGMLRGPLMMNNPNGHSIPPQMPPMMRPDMPKLNPIPEGGIGKATFPSIGAFPPGAVGLNGAAKHTFAGMGEANRSPMPRPEMPKVDGEKIDAAKPDLQGKPSFDKPMGITGALIAKQRIDQGVRNGSLTKEEADTLISQQKEIGKAVKDARSDGKVTEEEQKALNDSIKKADQAIYDAKHNDVMRALKQADTVKTVEASTSTVTE